ncbi:AMP-binding protein [Acuticoccus sp.]|uniref:AMP-binding protein n=1 Tax=Acuticoccus sp. TaxID=1904378 RepID=UPI003B51C935
MPTSASEIGAIWTPTERHLTCANATRLAARVGVADYDALRAFARAEPFAYWRALFAETGFVWSTPPAAGADFSAGREFPRWFPGGALNWVDTVYRFADDQARADALAVVAECESGPAGRVTYRELRERSAAMAAGLKARGVGRGDRVGLLIENGVEAVIAFLAISHLGAIVSPLFSGFGPDAIVSRLAACEAKALITTRGFTRRGRFVHGITIAQDVKRRVPSLEFVVVAGAEAPLPDGFLAWSDAVGCPADAGAAERMDPNDPFMVIYTSGTTGKPKGAVHTHGGFPPKILNDSFLCFDVTADSVYCWPADMGWIAGSLVMSSALLLGATLVCYDGAPDMPDLSRMAQLVETHRVTHFGSSPTLIRAMAADEAVAVRGDLSSIRILITAGETISPEHFAWYFRTFGRSEVPVINYTGGTEVSGGLLSNVPVEPIVPSGFAGPIAGVDVDVVGPSGEPVRGAVGELAIMEPFVGMTQAFWRDRERYLSTYWEAIPGIWIHGDLARRDPDGTFFLLGRSDDTIKVAGKRVGPAEVEEIAATVPEVNEIAVIGVEDKAKGQALVVFTVLHPGAPADGVAERIAATVATNLGKPFTPKAVHVVAQLPKTRSNKVMRRVIRSVYGGGPPGDLTSLQNPDAVDDIRAAIGR